jgi:hypothetical protein
MPGNLRELAEQDADYIQREFIKSKRHTIEVHYHPFLRKLKKEIPDHAPQWEERPTLTTT